MSVRQTPVDRMLSVHLREAVFALLDIDECQTSYPCGANAECANTVSAFDCSCVKGYQATDPDVPPGKSNLCIDVDECFNSTVCGPHSICTNTIGSYTCACKVGFRESDTTQPPSEINICIDIDECFEDIIICGPDCNCTNTIGSYICTCHSGYRLYNKAVIASYQNPCQGLQEILNEIEVKEGQSKERAFLDNMDKELVNSTTMLLPDATVTNCFAASMEVSSVGPGSKLVKVSSEGDGETGTVILGISDRLVSALLRPSQNMTRKNLHTLTVDMSLYAVRPGSDNESDTPLTAKGNTMELNMKKIAKENNGSAGVAFLTLTGMDKLLSDQYFKSENQTEMYSDVITATIPQVNTSTLTDPVNFTIYHKNLPERGFITCVYWEHKPRNETKGQAGVSKSGGGTMRWATEGCWVAYSGENYTVCSCSHLSTFALIMQIGEPPLSDPFLEWLNRICVIIGLFFLALAILTFVLCSWNPKINNTARLHLCLSLFFSHLLMLWNDRYVEYELACTVLAGLQHFLVIASFVWMLLEALQLHLLVRRLSKVQVIQRDGLPRLLLYLIGYGVPFVIVGVSALVYSDGYGATKAKLNWMLFLATLWSLRPTLANMKSDVSQSKDTRLIIFKILAQFIILGCTWILGFYQTNLFFQVLFIILNSQQGTFLYIVHCLFNKEVVPFDYHGLVLATINCETILTRSLHHHSSGRRTLARPDVNLGYSLH
ncbi:adhesion G protein-coupled receptor E1-like [Thalassophryne amazonica]|uniref:adhesion G protein-coupled receptor E1-like n=1 Tax=Thalassophryne amazonica TaxID=390379 RepID=UPI001471B543|nr:adhesion G protein-coupled receptor E1-like [Thalassophryne amazonica]